MRNYLVFAGVDSRDFGVYISGQGTFSAPQKAYTYYNVPGRNGAIIGDDHRLENIEVTYECFIYADFNENVANFRSFLLSLDGYQELSDSYHPDEYRMALYEGPFEPEVTMKNDAGSFSLTFNCKPQRYLVTGDMQYAWVPNDSQNIFGNPILVDTQLMTQDWLWICEYANAQDGTVINYAKVINIRIQIENNGNIIEETLYNQDISKYRFTIATANLASGVVDIMVVRMVLDLPKTGWTKTNNTTFWIPAQDVINYTMDNQGFDGYDPSIDFIYSVVGSDIAKTIMSEVAPTTVHGTISYDSANDRIVVTLSNTWFSDVSDFETYLSINDTIHIDAHVELDGTGFAALDPFTASFPTSGFFTLKDVGDSKNTKFEFTYESDEMANPTYFASSPLIRVYGTGSFVMDGVTITVSDCNSYVDIDCELMDCYEGSINRNADVSFSTYDFPKLQPGYSQITNVTGFTKVEITPRWWQL